MIQLLNVVRDINRTEIWYERNDFIENTFIYSTFFSSLLQSGGYFSVVDRVSPFNGAYTSKDWISQWLDIPCEIVQIADWLGTNIWYCRNSCELHGETFLRLYRCCEETRNLFHSRTHFAAWQPPAPDDFAAYTADGTIACFVNRHENELRIRKGLGFERLFEIS